MSVVIPTRDRKRLLQCCLQAIFKQTVPTEDYEVIVIDDGSQDGTSEFLASFRAPGPFNFTSQANRGAGAARNVGASMARGTILVFLDDDIIAGPNLLEAHLTMLERDPASVAVGRIDVVSAGFDVAASDTYERLLRRADGDRSPGDRLDAHDLLTGNCSISRWQFQDVGGFDERLKSNEDLELGLRLFARGVAIRWCPAASAQELYSRGIDLFLEDAWRRGHAHGLITATHPQAARRLPLARFYSGPPHRRLARSIAWFVAAVLSKRPARPLIRGNSMARLARLRWARWIIAAVNYWGGVRSALGSRQALRRAVDRRLLVLGYHVVDDPVAGPLRPYAVPPGRFARQMAYLAGRGFKTVSLEDWTRFLEGRGTLPERPMVISIDDGDLRTVERVQPILAEHGFSCTLFVVAGALGDVNSWESAEFPRRRLVGADDLRHLSGSGWEVGCHGMKHRRLPEIAEHERVEETQHARILLSSVLGKQIRFYAYPYGNVNRAGAAAVQRAGYSGACGSLPGINHADRNPYRMRRIFLTSADGPRRIAVKIRFARWHLLPLARWIVTGLLGRLRSSI